MLTNIYYYQLYRPYLLRQAERPSGINKKSLLTQRPDVQEDALFMLNKTLKPAILSHVRQTSNAINRTKNSARHIINEMQGFNQHTMEHGLEYSKARTSLRLQQFANDHRESISFMITQDHSEDLMQLGEELIELFSGGQYELEQVSLRTSDGKEILFDNAEFYEKDIDELNRAFSQSIGLFNYAYREAHQVLMNPMIDHMNFKELNYYYNYKLGTVVADTFKAIEAGMIINTRI